MSQRTDLDQTNVRILLNAKVREPAHLWDGVGVKVDVMRRKKRPTFKWESVEMLVVLKTHGIHVLSGARLSKLSAPPNVKMPNACSIVSLMNLRKRSTLNRVSVKEPVVSTKKMDGKQDCTHSAVSTHARQIDLDAPPNAETMRRLGPIPGGADGNAKPVTSRIN